MAALGLVSTNWQILEELLLFFAAKTFPTSICLLFQGYALCVLDYDFLILDNAFLVHKPGIKIYKKDTRRAMLAGKTNQLIKKIIFPELKVLYGSKKGCAV